MHQEQPPPAGWYDAGVPGRLRWWDGTQWTEHECDAPFAQPASVAMAQPASLPYGWYEFEQGGSVRWWDGSHWNAYRIKNGKPGADWFAMEPPTIGTVFGPVFLLLGSLQLLLALGSSGTNYAGIITMLLGVFWSAAGAANSMIRRKPAPLGAPLALEQVMPLPGVVDGAGAGWYTIHGKTSRWWTGARWAGYLAEAGRVRPSHGLARVYRLQMIIGWSSLGVGALLLILGFALNAIYGFDWGRGVTGVALFSLPLGAVLAVIIGPLVLGIARYRRGLMLMPEGPPAPGSAA